jgi:hypothetical protein
VVVDSKNVLYISTEILDTYIKVMCVRYSRTICREEIPANSAVYPGYCWGKREEWAQPGALTGKGRRSFSFLGEEGEGIEKRGVKKRRQEVVSRWHV